MKAIPVILIVDDNPKNLQILGTYLRNESYKVEFALDGKSALNWIQRIDFDLVLLDIMMPGIDGFEVCRIIKNDVDKQKIPIIFLTAKVDIESILSGFEIGAVDYVTKPFNKRELIARVKIQIEIKRSRDLIAESLREIREKSKLITDSIRYAQTIQSAILKACQDGSEYFPEMFSFKIPRDMVNGDFYWFHKINNKLLTGVFDCTGHGIPGALMSILGVTLLNETVIREKITQPHLILNRLREKIIEALGQKGISSEVKDGMDGSIISYDMESRKLIMSGAHSPVYFVHNNEMIEFKGDRIPLSYHDVMSGFSFQEVETIPGDLVYMSTDGFMDQFGEISQKKFGHAQFKELIIINHKDPMDVQKQSFLDTYYTWKGSEEQVDDIAVVGLKL